VLVERSFKVGESSAPSTHGQRQREFENGDVEWSAGAAHGAVVEVPSIGTTYHYDVGGYNNRL